MSHRTSLLCTVITALSLPMTSFADPTDTKPRERSSLSNLSMEVAALQTLHRFQLTAKQLETLRKLAPDTMMKADDA